MKWTFNTIAVLHSPCKEKFAVPRQSGLAPNLEGQIEILAPYDQEQAFIELEGFSHIWVLGVFHQAQIELWHATVRPPRLGGNKRVGVFASRSPYRPNPISLSVFKLNAITRRSNVLYMDVSGTDLVDGTPILDIKPYLPYADNIAHATAGYTAGEAKPELTVEFSSVATQQCANRLVSNGKDLKRIITELLRLDPRPAYKSEQNQAEFGMRIDDFNIRFRVSAGIATVLSVVRWE